MDNIIIEKVWEDECIIDLKVTAMSKFVTAYQTCYTSKEEIEDISKMIIAFSKDFSRDYYVQIGNKQGNYTPAFSMNFQKADYSGHVKIEMDIEVADIDNRSHRCLFFVEGELGAIERLGKNLKNICEGAVGEEISLFEK